MFIGRYYHSLEDSGRCSLPKTFREATENWVVTPGFEGGLLAFPANQFATQISQASSRPFTSKKQRDFWRYLANDATQVTADKLGRIQLPEYLLSAANLTKALVIVGSVEYIEVWDRDRYHQYRETLDQQAAAIADELAEESHDHE